MARIYPSLIAANPLYLHNAIERLAPYCAGFHCDIMDNQFVPNLTFGAAVVNAIDAASRKQTWVHLMVNDPINWCKTLTLKADSIVSFHFEATKDIPGIIKSIKEKNWNASLAINPKTAVAEIFPFLNLIDQVLIMSVEPGFSGQRFLEPVLDKVGPLLAHRQKKDLTFNVGMDGGINAENIGMIIKAGVDDLAIASAIFDQPDPVAALKRLDSLSKSTS